MFYVLITFLDGTFETFFARETQMREDGRFAALRAGGFSWYVARVADIDEIKISFDKSVAFK